MIGENPIGHVDAVLVVVADASLVSRCAGAFLDGVEKRQEQVGIVIRAFVLYHRDETFQTQATIDVLFREGLKLTTLFPENSKQLNCISVF